MEQEINDTEELRRWFRQCPVLNPTNKFGVDYLPETTTEYAIYSSPTAIRTHQNVLDETVLSDVQELNFIFAAKVDFGNDVKHNLANLAFFQSVCAWVVIQNNNKNFPAIREGKVQSLVPTITAYPAEVGPSAAKYQIQLKLTYRRL